ncbi:tyrosine--tRNA ligase [Candidatus Gracilibacteria bacterium]|nr:tyrosine--tRNA ligase [Candidatus Gracilibacteria bacterium]
MVGCNISMLDIVFAENLYESKKNQLSYWNYEMVISKKLSLSRVLKSISITGKVAGEDVDFGTLRYAPMQVADCFFMNNHLVHSGMDQRKVHVLMRETAPKLDYEHTLKIAGKPIKPIAIHHGLLLGMKKESGEGEEIVIAKMSKSKPDTCIFVHDSPDNIEKKIKKAYCPMVEKHWTMDEIKKVQQYNPMLNWLEMMVFPANRQLQVFRPVAYGGDKLYSTFEEVKEDYFSGNLHPSDLKSALANNLIEWFKPIKSFADNNIDILDLFPNKSTQSQNT